MIEWQSPLDEVHGAGELSLEAKRNSNREAIFCFTDAITPIDTFYATRLAASLTIRDVLRDYGRRHEYQLQEARYTSILHSRGIFFDDQEAE